MLIYGLRKKNKQHEILIGTLLVLNFKFTLPYLRLKYKVEDIF